MDILFYSVVKITGNGTVWMSCMQSQNQVFQVNLDNDESGDVYAELTGHELSAWCAKHGYTYQHRDLRIGASAF